MVPTPEVWACTGAAMQKANMAAAREGAPMRLNDENDMRFLAPKI
jgi:hypothetical protein